MDNIKNIIFDLGGVFLNIDFKITEQDFRDLGVTGFSDMFNQHHSNDLFEQLETGKISPEAFYEAFRLATKSQLTDEQIRDAWNALLLDFPPERLLWLDKIMKKYRVYLYSNTNLIHYDAFMDSFRKTTGRKDFNAFFLKAWYSHELGLRKPYADSFRQILQQENLNPAETLFIDDTLKNIEGAREAGMEVIHLVPPMTVLDLEI